MEVAPLRNDLAEGPEGGAAHWAEAEDGVRLRIGGWRAGAKGTVLIFNGRTEYIEKYGRIASLLAADGYAAASIDWRGQGLSDRVASDPNIGHVAEFSDYQRDAAVFLDAVRAMDFPEPYFLLGHSMGGAIGLRALVNGLPVERAVFSGPMWGINFPIWLKPLTGAILGGGTMLGMEMAYAPGTGPTPYPFRQPFRGNRLTNDRESYDWMRAHIRAEPRYGLGGPSIRWLRQGLSEAKDLMTIKEIPCPALTLLGEEEDTVDPAAARSLGGSWPNGAVQTIPGAKHECMMEGPATRQDVVQRIVAHFEAP